MFDFIQRILKLRCIFLLTTSGGSKYPQPSNGGPAWAPGEALNRWSQLFFTLPCNIEVLIQYFSGAAHPYIRFEKAPISDVFGFYVALF